MSEVNTLVGNGLGHGATKVVRTMLETAINAEFLLRFPEYLDDYIDYLHVENYKMLEYCRQHVPDEYDAVSDKTKQEITSRFQAVESRFLTKGAKPRVRDSWCAVGLSERAIRTDFAKEYRIIYPMGNKLIHGSFAGMSMHSDPNNPTPRISPPPSLVLCKSALGSGHTCALRIVATVAEALSVESDPSLDVLQRDYNFAWSGSTGDSE